MKKKEEARWFDYTITGVLGKTPPNQTPTQFTVRGTCTERYTGLPGGRTNRGATILIPEHIGNFGNFIETIPLGTRVRFRESGSRKNNKYFAHSFSIEVVGKAKRR